MNLNLRILVPANQAEPVVSALRLANYNAVEDSKNHDLVTLVVVNQALTTSDLGVIVRCLKRLHPIAKHTESGWVIDAFHEPRPMICNVGVDGANLADDQTSFQAVGQPKVVISLGRLLKWPMGPMGAPEDFE